MKKIWVCCTLLFAQKILADGLSLEEVIVYGHSASQIGQTLSASEGTISQEDLAIRPLLRTGEILEAVPGMVATQHSGSGKANQYFLRGFNLDHGTDFATSIDGMPINMRSHGHGQGYTDLNFLIPEFIGGIHYKKGPYYSDVGDFSGTGSAEISTTDEIDRKISIGIGENDFYRTLFLGETEAAGGNLMAAAEYQTYSGPWDSINEDVGKKNLWLKQIWNTGSGEYALDVMAYKNQWNSADQIPERAVDSGFVSYLGSIDTSVGGESSRYSLSGSMKQNLNENTSFRGHLYAIKYHLNLWSDFSYFTEPDGDQFQQIDNRHIFGGDLAVSHVNHLASMDMVNTWGFQSRYDDIDKVGLSHTAERQLLNPIRSDAIVESSNSLYWQNKLKITENLRSEIGARYDYFSFEVTPLDAQNKDSLSQNGGEKHAGIATANGSLIFTLTPEQEIYSGAGQGFHSNDARGVTIKADPVSNQPLSAVDPLVKTFGYEIGWRGNFVNGLNTSIALWHLDIDSELIYVGDEGVTEDTGIGSNRKGVELTSYYHLNSSWTLDLEYAYTQARFNEALDGSRLIPGALKQVLTAGINWQLSEKIFADLKWRHFDGYPLDAGASAKGSNLFNLRLGYKPNENLGLTLDVLNIFNSKDHDVEYFYESQLPGEAAPVADHHFHAFEPRTLRAYVEWKF